MRYDDDYEYDLNEDDIDSLYDYDDYDYDDNEDDLQEWENYYHSVVEEIEDE